MLQVKEIRENKERFINNLLKRGFDVTELFENILRLDDNRRNVQAKLDETFSSLNKLSDTIRNSFKSGDLSAGNKAKDRSSILKEGSKEIKINLSKIIDELQKLLYLIPNVPNDSVPSGTKETDNDQILSKGKLPILPKNHLPHWKLCKKYDIIDFEAGVKLSGSGFPVYKGKGARLQRALISYFLDKNIEAGYVEYQVPHLVNEESCVGTGQLPDKDGQMYYSKEDDLYLIPTSEIPITNMFRGSLLLEKDLPIKCTGYTPCFRRESGSYGSDVRGLNRLHQFDKVEIVCIDHPKNSYETFVEMVNHIESILIELELPFRVLNLCGGDLSFTSSLTYDFEVFSASQDKWLEVSSVSNFETFQSNRLKIRFKDRDGKNKLTHTLNGSSLALPRVLASILENYQTKDGIKIPKVLIPYCKFDIIN